MGNGANDESVETSLQNAIPRHRSFLSKRRSSLMPDTTVPSSSTGSSRLDDLVAKARSKSEQPTPSPDQYTTPTSSILAGILTKSGTQKSSVVSDTLPILDSDCLSVALEEKNLLSRKNSGEPVEIDEQNSDDVTSSNEIDYEEEKLNETVSQAEIEKGLDDTESQEESDEQEVKDPDVEDGMQGSATNREYDGEKPYGESAKNSLDPPTAVASSETHLSLEELEGNSGKNSHTEDDLQISITNQDYDAEKSFVDTADTLDSHTLVAGTETSTSLEALDGKSRYTADDLQDKTTRNDSVATAKKSLEVLAVINNQESVKYRQEVVEQDNDLQISEGVQEDGPEKSESEKPVTNESETKIEYPRGSEIDCQEESLTQTTQPDLDPTNSEEQVGYMEQHDTTSDNLESGAHDKLILDETTDLFMREELQHERCTDFEKENMDTEIVDADNLISDNIEENQEMESSVSDYNEDESCHEDVSDFEVNPHDSFRDIGTEQEIKPNRNDESPDQIEGCVYHEREGTDLVLENIRRSESFETEEERTTENYVTVELKYSAENDGTRDSEADISRVEMESAGSVQEIETSNGSHLRMESIELPQVEEDDCKSVKAMEMPDLDNKTSYIENSNIQREEISAQASKNEDSTDLLKFFSDGPDIQPNPDFVDEADASSAENLGHSYEIINTLTGASNHELDKSLESKIKLYEYPGESQIVQDTESDTRNESIADLDSRDKEIVVDINTDLNLLQQQIKNDDSEELFSRMDEEEYQQSLDDSENDKIEDEDSEEELEVSALEPLLDEAFVDDEITDMSKPAELLLRVKAAVTSYLKQMENPVPIGSSDQLDNFWVTFIRFVSLSRLVYGMISWETFGSVVELSSYYLYREMYEQATLHADQANDMLESLKRGDIKPKRSNLQHVCILHVVLMYSLIEKNRYFATFTKRCAEAIVRLQCAMEAVSKVYYLSNRCERILKKAKADLDSSLGNFDAAVEEYEQMQEFTRALPGEETDSEIKGKIINLTKIAKIHSDNEQFGPAIAEYETIYNLCKQIEDSSENLVDLARSISRICISAIKNGETFIEYKKKAVSYAQILVTLEKENQTTSTGQAHRNMMSAQVLLGRAYLAVGNYTKAMAVVNETIKQAKEIHGKFSLSFIQCLIRRASANVQGGNIEKALAEIYRSSPCTQRAIGNVLKSGVERDISDLHTGNSFQYDDELSPKTFQTVKTSSARFLSKYPDFKGPFNAFLSMASVEGTRSIVVPQAGMKDSKSKRPEWRYP